jgi:hypothetical protein
MRSSINSKFGKEERFRKSLQKGPAPDTYAPKQTLGHDVSSKHLKAPVPKIGNGNYSVLEREFLMKRAKENPGPGQYTHYTEFAL